MKKTVFVVGAGASFEFGLPVGEKLKETISESLQLRTIVNGGTKVGDELITKALSQVNLLGGSDALSASKTLQAAANMSYALPLTLSIDNYLHSHNGDEAVEICGKLAIVRAILVAEAKSKLYTANDAYLIDFAKCTDTWLVKFMRILTEDCDLSKLCKRLETVTFIIFNYDRCIEHFLMCAIQAVYKVDTDTAWTVMCSVKIYHPYGTVGVLPWTTESLLGDLEMDFGGTPDPKKLLELAKGIKTFTEGTDSNISAITSIREHITEASGIVFLGFAYHKINMRLLFADDSKIPRSNRRVYGTAYGMSNSDTAAVTSQLKTTLANAPVVIENTLTCSQLFHEFSRTLSF